MHLRAAQLLGVGLLAGGHLHERRAAEEHARAVADEDRVVAQAGDVRAAGGRAAEDERDRRDVEARQARQVAEHRAAGHELVGLRREVGAAGLDQVDERQPVALGDLLGAQRLAQRVRVVRPAADRRVVAGDHALDALDRRRCRSRGCRRRGSRSRARCTAAARGTGCRGRGAARCARGSGACRGRGGARRTSARPRRGRPRAARRAPRAGRSSRRGSPRPRSRRRRTCS